MVVGCQCHAPAALLPGKGPGTHFTGGGPQGRFGEVRKVSLPTGFDPRTGRSGTESLFSEARPGFELIFSEIHSPDQSACVSAPYSARKGDDNQ